MRLPTSGSTARYVTTELSSMYWLPGLAITTELSSNALAFWTKYTSQLKTGEGYRKGSYHDHFLSWFQLGVFSRRKIILLGHMVDHDAIFSGGAGHLQWRTKRWPSHSMYKSDLGWQMNLYFTQTTGDFLPLQKKEERNRRERRSSQMLRIALL